MGRSYAARRESGRSVLMSAALLTVLVWKPEWVYAAVMASAHWFDAVASPVIVRIITGG